MDYYVEIHRRLDSSGGVIVRREGPFPTDTVGAERDRIGRSYQREPDYSTKIVRQEPQSR